MKTKSKNEMADDLRPEYDLRKLLRNGVQGKYAARCRKGTNLVLLDPEVAKAFPNESCGQRGDPCIIRDPHSRLGHWCSSKRLG